MCPAGLAVAATRRRTLAVAAAAMALRAGPAAGKQTSCKKKARKRTTETCTRMREACLAYYDVRCAESSDPPACRAELALCCGHLEVCNFTEYVQCIDRPR